MGLVHYDLPLLFEVDFGKRFIFPLRSLVVLLDSGLVVLESVDWLVEWLGDFYHRQASVHGGVRTEVGLIVSGSSQSLLVLSLGDVEVVEEGAHGVGAETDVDVLKFKLSILVEVPPGVPRVTSSHVDVNPGLVFVLVVLDEFVD